MSVTIQQSYLNYFILDGYSVNGKGDLPVVKAYICSVELARNLVPQINKRLLFFH